MVAQAWEHLQNVLLQVQNRRVRDEFSDVEGDDDNISTPRASLRAACTLKDADSAIMTLLRLWLFEITLGGAASLQTPVYGIPVPSYQEARKFRPQIQLYFQEDENDIETGYAPVTGEINVRLMNESATTLTEADLQVYANKIRSNFATGGGFLWQKGKTMVTYTDSARGYKLQLLCRSKAEGRRVIEQVLDVQGHVPDWKFMNCSENEEPASRFPTIPPNEQILGRSRRMPRQRPVASVRFRYAMIHIHGLPHPIILVDRTRLFRNALVRAYQ